MPACVILEVTGNLTSTRTVSRARWWLMVMALLLRVERLCLCRLFVEGLPLSEGIHGKLLRIASLFVLDGLDGGWHDRVRAFVSRGGV